MTHRTELEHRLAAARARRIAAGRERTLVPVDARHGTVIRRAGREFVNFSANDYLGLASHPALVVRACDWTRRWGTGAGAARLVCGDIAPFAEVEAKIAAGKGKPAALIFGAGFQANSAVLATLLDRTLWGAVPLVFADRLIHASMYHGLAAAGIGPIRFRHNDLDHLETLLRRHADKDAPRFILTETVFSMDGDRADLDGLERLAQAYGAYLYVDEAHATGVLGPDGFGLAAHRPGIDVVMGTFSKALGAYGAYIACSQALRDHLINHCPGFIYATGLPPGVLGAVDAALDLLPALGPQRTALAQKAETLRGKLTAAGLDTGGSTTQIVPVVLGSETRALAVMAGLEAAGMLAIAIRPPTVPPGASRLRIALSAAHDDADIDALADAVISLAGAHP